MIRSLTTLLLAMAMTLATFWLMMRMVSVPPDTDYRGPSIRAVEFLRLRREPEPPPPSRAPEPEPPPPEIPEVRLTTPEQTPPPAAPHISTGRFALRAIAHDLEIQGGPYLGAMLPDPAPVRPQTLMVVKRVPPLYPRRALRRKVEGWVEVALTIAPDGSVAQAKVTRSKPPGTFDKAALKAVRRWRFQPREGSGAVQATQKIEFNLEH